MASTSNHVVSNPKDALEQLELRVRAAPARGLKALVERLSQRDVASARTLSLFLHGSAEGVGVASVLESLPNLRSALVFVDGASSDGAWPRRLTDLAQATTKAKPRSIDLAAGFWLDDAADGFATMAGKESSLTAVRDASRSLMREGVAVRWVVPITPILVFRLEAIVSLAKDEGVDPVLVQTPESALSPDERLFAKDFILYRLLDEERSSLSKERMQHYENLARHYGGSFAVPPPRVRGARIELDGEAPRDLDSPRQEARAPWFLGTPAGSPRAHERKRMAADLAEVAVEGQRALLEWTRAQVTRRAPPTGDRDRELPSVLLIGAYGGEHIGDLAILGGVLRRVHERHGTKRAILVSQREDHTRHLIPMLDSPVALTVEKYDQATIAEHLAKVDGVVFAGGPLMDLPKQLTKHLYAVSLARRSGKPFVVEGIGVGPFARRESEWVARRLVLMAERVAVRTNDDAEKRLVADLAPDRGRDPAFDYLETRAAQLTRISAPDRPWLERMLRGTEGRIVVGLNVRPIRYIFTTVASGADQGERTLDVEGRFFRELADGLRRFQDRAKKPVSYLFFPMNAIQFGMSDMRSAYRLGRELGNDVDYRVWEGDASLDGVLELLRRLDLVVAMRFHAAIFALSQKRPVIGIDYRVGKRDKVAALLDDCGFPDDYRRIDELTGDWLGERLAHRLLQADVAVPPLRL